MWVHIGTQKHANCFDQFFSGSSFLPQSTTLKRNQHLCDVIIVMLQWKEPENWKNFQISKQCFRFLNLHICHLLILKLGGF